ncbi:hypothetical protein C8Q79DRAFT_192463 [Trametes meyenii]|nr:hypothetical protein C8Q79DRAFT_192463 [Trametes meyenii]
MYGRLQTLPAELSSRDENAFTPLAKTGLFLCSLFSTHTPKMAPSRTKKTGGSGPGWCDVCQKDVKRDFSRHMLQHGEPIIPCPYSGCTHRFNQRQNLQSHIDKWHLGIRRHACHHEWVDERGHISPCVATFDDQGALTRHRKNMHGYVPKARDQGAEVRFRGVAQQAEDGHRYGVVVVQRAVDRIARKRAELNGADAEPASDAFGSTPGWVAGCEAGPSSSVMGPQAASSMHVAPPILSLNNLGSTLYATTATSVPLSSACSRTAAPSAYPSARRGGDTHGGTFNSPDIVWTSYDDVPFMPTRALRANERGTPTQRYTSIDFLGPHAQLLPNHDTAHRSAGASHDLGCHGIGPAISTTADADWDMCGASFVIIGADGDEVQSWPVRTVHNSMPPAPAQGSYGLDEWDAFYRSTPSPGASSSVGSSPQPERRRARGGYTRRYAA